MMTANSRGDLSDEKYSWNRSHSSGALLFSNLLWKRKKPGHGKERKLGQQINPSQTFNFEGNGQKTTT
ncbi:MAG: hypothetical protein MI725_05220, partial [Pirellulales bacterium]|nr:hypothetical protein [Pirellulales bacterium]